MMRITPFVLFALAVTSCMEPAVAQVERGGPVIAESWPGSPPAVADLELAVFAPRAASTQLPSTVLARLGVQPLTVELATGHVCPAPSATRGVLDLGVGCPAPWRGLLYTPQADASVRDEIATLDRVCDALSTELAACRTTRDERTAQGATAVERCGEGHVLAAELAEGRGLAEVSQTAPPAASKPAWPWALGAVGVGAGGGLVAKLSGGSSTAVVASTVGAAAAGVGFTAFMDWVTG